MLQLRLGDILCKTQYTSSNNKTFTGYDGQEIRWRTQPYIICNNPRDRSILKGTKSLLLPNYITQNKLRLCWQLVHQNLF